MKRKIKEKNSLTSFTKYERLSKKSQIDELFQKGKFHYVDSLKFVSLPMNGLDVSSVLIQVSKRNFKKAVTRNLLKRRLRESYRNSKDAFYQRLNVMKLNLVIAIVYNDKCILDYHQINEQLIKGLNKICDYYEKYTN